ncbi:MAG: EAL domain-containing protein, partial [Candidatus Calescibacterium sp.]|nr:EAL domain-containing protein [Candidatus Calescibacterium sp.]
KKKIKCIWYYVDNSIFIICFDISREMGLVEELNKKEEFLNSLLNYIPQGIILVNPDSLRIIKYKSSIYTDSICKMMGVKEGVSFYDTLPSDKLNFIKYNVDYVKMAGGYRTSLLNLDIPSDGMLVRKNLQLTFIKVNTISVLIVINDITEFIELKEKYEYLSLHDPLTDLPNRRYIIEQLKQLVIHCARHQRKLAILFTDIDNFKDINDTYGHEVGDNLLKSVSQAIRYSLRPGDVVGRIGGDEFIIILDDVAKIEDVQIVCKRIIENSKEYCHKIGLNITMSIGISIYPDDSHNPDELIRFADIAMYKAKERGKDNFEFYSKEFSIKLKHRIEMIDKINNAIDKESFTVYYQPIIDIRGIMNLVNEQEIRNEIISKDLVIGLEALIRWFDKGRLISPLEFIPLAEETNLIIPLGRIVLKIATKQLSKYDKQLFVNVSSKEFEYSLYFDNLPKIAKENDFDINKLNLEITESLIIKNVESFLKRVENLKGKGIKICIDDFGSGYSSFSSLINIPANIIKIDRFFIEKIEENEKVRKIVKTIIDIAEILGFGVVAEGVETIQQLKILKDYGCSFAQGFLFFRPMPLEEVEKIIAPAGK